MSLKEFRERMKRGPTDVTGIDFGQASTKIVRLQKSGESFSLMGAELAPVLLHGESNEAILIPPKLKARYVAIAVSGGTAVTKLLTFPGTMEHSFETNLAKTLGLDPQTGDRIAYRMITEGSGRTESRILAAAIPEADAASAMRMFATGLPAPCSLEVSALAALTAFEAGPVLNSPEPAAGMIDFGTETSTLSIFYKKSLVLLRRFDFGISKLLDRVTSALHIDADTALNILSDNAFDISELITEIMGPFSSQLIVSRDFVERRENCSLKKLYCIGGIATTPVAIHELERTLGLEVQMFDPFSIPLLHPSTPDAVPDDQRWRFTAAIGAALGTLQETP